MLWLSPLNVAVSPIFLLWYHQWQCCGFFLTPLSYILDVGCWRYNAVQQVGSICPILTEVLQATFPRKHSPTHWGARRNSFIHHAHYLFFMKLILYMYTCLFKIRLDIDTVKITMLLKDGLDFFSVCKLTIFLLYIYIWGVFAEEVTEHTFLKNTEDKI